jgi:fumarate reductase subunit C
MRPLPYIATLILLLVMAATGAIGIAAHDWLDFSPAPFAFVLAIALVLLAVLVLWEPAYPKIPEEQPWG